MKDNRTQGIFASFGRALDESVSVLNELRAGRLTRSEFDRWYDRRRQEGMDAVFQARDAAAGMAEPFGVAFDIGSGLMRGAPSRPRRRASRRKASVRRR